MLKNSSEITIRSATNADCERIQALVFGVLREYGLEPEPGGTDLDLSDIESHYIDRGGIFELLENAEGELLGTVGLYPVNGEIVELRKMYFVQELRGHGIGRETLARMIERAREMGFKRMYLETASVLESAIALYKKFGFVETEEKHSPRCDQAFYLNL